MVIIFEYLTRNYRQVGDKGLPDGNQFELSVSLINIPLIFIPRLELILPNLVAGSAISVMSANFPAINNTVATIIGFVVNTEQ